MSLPHRLLLPPVLTPEDLASRWELLAEDGDITPDRGYGTDLLAQVFDADGVQGAPLILIEDVPDLPEVPFTDNLAAMAAMVLAEETAGIGSVAFALSPATPRDIRAADLQWATALTQACDRAEVRVLGLHLLGRAATRVV